MNLLENMKVCGRKKSESHRMKEEARQENDSILIQRHCLFQKGIEKSNSENKIIFYTQIRTQIKLYFIGVRRWGTDF